MRGYVDHVALPEAWDRFCAMPRGAACAAADVTPCTEGAGCANVALDGRACTAQVCTAVDVRECRPRACTAATAALCAPTGKAAARLQAKVRDISEFLIELGPVQPTHPVPVRATYHDACHLAHAQGVRAQPRRLLELLTLAGEPVAMEVLGTAAGAVRSLTTPVSRAKTKALAKRRAADLRSAPATCV